MIRLEDIAKRAGVSHSTVSRALADSPLVNADTRKRIQLLAREAGYQVNQVARNLKSRHTRTIGLVVPEVSNPYYPKVVQLVADSVREAGYSLQLHLSGARQEAESECIASLCEQRADGILLVTAEQGLVARERVDALAASGFPIVLMGWVENAEHLDMVTGDDAKGGCELARLLLDLGHRRIAILGKASHRGKYDRLFGFAKALDEAGVVVPEAMRIAAATDSEAEAGVERLLALPAPPTAIFAYQDSLAALVIERLANAGALVPQDISVAGFDNLDIAAYISPRLTTVGGHIEPLATQFVNLLLARIRKDPPNAPPQCIVAAPRLVSRNSCAAPRRDDALPLKNLTAHEARQSAPSEEISEITR